MKVFGQIGCLLRGQHAAGPLRAINGGSAFTCARCGAALLDFDEAGYGSGYINPIRKLYERRHSVYTRTSSWDAEQGI